MVVVFGIFAGRAFLWHVVVAGGEELVVGSAYNHGDFALHLALVQHIGGGGAFWPESLLRGHHKMAYPLGVDLFHAMLVVVGMPVLAGFAWMGLVLSAVTLRELWRWGGAFVVGTFLFVGGFQAVGMFSGGGLRDYMGDWDWKSIPLAMFTTQRGLLFAIPAMLALMVSWRARCGGGMSRGCLPFWVELVLYAALPLVHMHTFLFGSLLLAMVFCMGGVSERRHFLSLGLAAAAPASLLVWLVVDFGGHQARSVAWAPGWLQGDSNGLTYWVMNFGLWLPLLAVVLVMAVRRWLCRVERDAWWDAAVVLVGCVVFMACVLVRFSPWAWDNTKLMLWSFLAAAPVAWKLVLAPMALPWRGAAIVLLMFSGAVSLAGGLRPPSPPNVVVRMEELDRVAAMLNGVPIDARIACAPDWNHPVILSGRKLAVGYDGHLWSHGYDYLSSMADLEALMKGEEDWRPYAEKLGADHVFWGPREQARFGHGRKSWIAEAEVVASDKSAGILYRLR